MHDFVDANRRHWDELVDIHARSSFYDLAGFKEGGSTERRSAFFKLEIQELGDVAGRTLLHLQCHFGMDTLSWARLGATVTGVDFSEESIALARSLSHELDIPAEFVCSDVYALPTVLDATFDVVYTSFGVLCWLPNLHDWAEVISHFLRPGGAFYIAEQHPFANIFSTRRAIDHLDIESSYFHSEHPRKFEGDGSYAAPDAKFTNDVTYEWQHSLSDVINALISAGLRIDFLHEHAFSSWRRFPFMAEGADGLWRLPEGLRDKLPLTFTLKATKA